jgi:hypothetical protein
MHSLRGCCHGGKKNRCRVFSNSETDGGQKNRGRVFSNSETDGLRSNRFLKKQEQAFALRLSKA